METKYNQLTQEEQAVILHKGTERSFTGKYNDNKSDGVYHCKQCNAPLFNADAKFNSGTGWPSFDDTIPNAVKEIPDADRRRVEIVCAVCGGHLGHVFKGERMTQKSVRHCVNSISLDFKEENLKYAYFAGGCFWGVEYYFEELAGVKSAISGYMGGKLNNPSYTEVCSGQSGHIEVVKVEYDSSLVSFETLTRLFFEIHNPTQTNGQGPDIGSQYLSAIFYNNQEEKEISKDLINLLENKGFKIATKLISTLNTPFFEAEEYHQDYYFKHNKVPYCHTYIKRF